MSSPPPLHSVRKSGSLLDFDISWKLLDFCAWVTRPERLKGAKDGVKRPKRPPSRSRALRAPRLLAVTYDRPLTSVTCGQVGWLEVHKSQPQPRTPHPISFSSSSSCSNDDKEEKDWKTLCQPISSSLLSSVVQHVKAIILFLCVPRYVATPKLNLIQYLDSAELGLISTIQTILLYFSLILPTAIIILLGGCGEVKEALLHRVEPAAGLTPLAPMAPHSSTAWLHSSTTAGDIIIIIIDQLLSSQVTIAILFLMVTNYRHWASCHKKRCSWEIFWSPGKWKMKIQQVPHQSSLWMHTLK